MAIDTLKWRVKNIMRILIKLSLICLFALCATSCTPKMMGKLWNGGYSLEAINNKFKRDYKAYHANKSPEWNISYEKNRTECWEIPKKKYPIINYEQSESQRTKKIYYYENQLRRQKWTEIYEKCMIDRGTPVFIYKP